MSSFSREFLIYQLQSLYDNATSARFCLYDSSAVTASANDSGYFAQLIAAELAGDGYARQSAAPSTDAEWDATNNRARIALLDAQFSSTSGTATFSGWFLLLNGTATANQTCTFNSGTDVVTSTAHGLSNTDKVIITVDSGGTLDTGFTANQIYYVGDSTTDTFKLYEEVGLSTVVDIAGDGSGQHRVRYANGDGALAVPLSSSRTLVSSPSENTISGAYDIRTN